MKDSILLRSIKMKKNWKNKNFRKIMLKAIVEYNKSEEWREKMSKRFISDTTRKNMSIAKKNITEETRNKFIIARSKAVFPTKDTSIEVKIQDFLKELKIEFFTHQYIREIKHRYQCDILVPSMNLVIECDGNYWHKYPIGKDIDHIRTSELIKNGFKVLRMWETEIKIMSLDEFRNIINKYNSN